MYTKSVVIFGYRVNENEISVQRCKWDISFSDTVLFCFEFVSYLVSRSRMHGTIPPILQCSFMPWCFIKQETHGISSWRGA